MKRFLALGISILLCTNVYSGNKSNPEAHLKSHFEESMDRLHQATFEPDVALPDIALSESDATADDSNGWTLLSFALNRDFHNIAMAFTNQNPVIIGCSLIHAIEHDNAQALGLVITDLPRYDQTIDMALDERGRTSLSYAIEWESVNCLRVLKERGASLTNAFIACIEQRNKEIFDMLFGYANPRPGNDPYSTTRALPALVEKAIAEEPFYDNICSTIGNESTLNFLRTYPIVRTPSGEMSLQHGYENRLKLTSLRLALEHDSVEEYTATMAMAGDVMDEQFVLNTAFDANKPNILKLTSIHTALEHDSVEEYTTAMAMAGNAGIVEPSALKIAIADNRPNMVNALTARGIFIPDPPCNNANQPLVIRYFKAYFSHNPEARADHIWIRSLYLFAKNNHYDQLASHILLTYVMEETDVKEDGVEYLSDRVAELAQQGIDVPLDTLLLQSVTASSPRPRIISWLCNERRVRLNLTTVIEDLSVENYQNVQDYMRYVIADLNTVPTDTFMQPLFILEYTLKEKVDLLADDFPEDTYEDFSDWYYTTILSVIESYRVPISATSSQESGSSQETLKNNQHPTDDDHDSKKARQK